MLGLFKPFKRPTRPYEMKNISFQFFVLWSFYPLELKDEKDGTQASTVVIGFQETQQS